MRHGLVLLGAAVLCLNTFGSAAIAGTIYDVADDWSLVSNPNGVWSYNQGDTPLPCKQDGWGGFGGDTFWTTTQSGTIPPAWCKAVTDRGTNWQPGDVIGHSTTPWPGSADGNITWTSPGDGVITISGKAWDAYHVWGRDDMWTLLVNGETYATRNSIYAIARTDSSALFENNVVSGKSLSNIAVQKGDVVKFDIHALTYYGHFVGVDLQIDYSAVAVPLPSSLASIPALLAGCVILPRLLRRR